MIGNMDPAVIFLRRREIMEKLELFVRGFVVKEIDEDEEKVV